MTTENDFDWDKYAPPEKETPFSPAQRQARRRRRLNELAQSLGFPTWGKLETAALRGDFILEIYDKPDCKQVKDLLNPINLELP